jgi:hypothetical protein
MLLQKAAWDGPVYSEGNNHFLYCGLTDGNYAQDQNYRIHENPWLVDFDLRCLHPHAATSAWAISTCSIRQSAPSDPDVAKDRFLAATVAFGHPGFLLYGRDGELRSYYMLQALASRYTQAAAETIRYADAAGALHETSAALANGAYTRSQVVTRYADGTVTAANGHPEARMAVTVPSSRSTCRPTVIGDAAETVQCACSAVRSTAAAPTSRSRRPTPTSTGAAISRGLPKVRPQVSRSAAR